MNSRPRLMLPALLLAAFLAVTVPATGDTWASADPSALGLRTRALQAFGKMCRDTGADACLVAHRGAIVFEWYGPGYAEPAYTMSSVKSWSALLESAGFHFIEPQVITLVDFETDGWVLDIILPDREIQTGYGQIFPPRERGLDHYVELATGTGFTVREQTVLEKPSVGDRGG